MAKTEPQPFTTKTGHSGVVRTAVPGDAAPVIALAQSVMVERIFTLTAADEFNPSIEKQTAWIQTHLDHPSHLVLVAEIDEAIIGMLDFSCGHRKRIEHTGQFGMSVVKDWRNQGVGVALLQGLVRWATAHERLENIELSVHATNERAIALYEKVGFVREGFRKRQLKYEDGSYVDSVLMTKFVKSLR